MKFMGFLEPSSIIALLALFVAMWSIVSSRKHNKLTVRPYLCESIEASSVNLICGFYISNKGLGPALIKSTAYYLDGKEVDFNEIVNVVENLPCEFGIHISKVRTGSAISKDEKIAVIEIKWDSLKYEIPENKEIKKRMSDDVKRFSRKLSERFGIVVEWESSYGEKGKIKSHPRKA